ncbi:hypothetical protein C8R44DRAFT_737833 [Mycena epipterygia]|nr:hypothetical protein C8R44DRAFT_737833 [Mycena epipterygia]
MFQLFLPSALLSPSLLQPSFSTCIFASLDLGHYHKKNRLLLTEWRFLFKSGPSLQYAPYDYTPKPPRESVFASCEAQNPEHALLPFTETSPHLAESPAPLGRIESIAMSHTQMRWRIRQVLCVCGSPAHAANRICATPYLQDPSATSTICDAQGPMRTLIPSPYTSPESTRLRQYDDGLTPVASAGGLGRLRTGLACGRAVYSFAELGSPQFRDPLKAGCGKAPTAPIRGESTQIGLAQARGRCKNVARIRVAVYRLVCPRVAENNLLDFSVPGGLVGVGTRIDPILLWSVLHRRRKIATCQGGSGQDPAETTEIGENSPCVEKHQQLGIHKQYYLKTGPNHIGKMHRGGEGEHKLQAVALNACGDPIKQPQFLYIYR